MQHNQVDGETLEAQYSRLDLLWNSFAYTGRFQSVTLNHYLHFVHSCTSWCNTTTPLRKENETLLPSLDFWNTALLATRFKTLKYLVFLSFSYVQEYVTQPHGNKGPPETLSCLGLWNTTALLTMRFETLKYSLFFLRLSYLSPRKSNTTTWK